MLKGFQGRLIHNVEQHIGRLWVASYCQNPVTILNRPQGIEHFKSSFPAEKITLGNAWYPWGQAGAGFIGKERVMFRFWSVGGVLNTLNVPIMQGAVREEGFRTDRSGWKWNFTQ